MRLQVRHDAIRDSQPSSIASELPGYQYIYQPAMSYPEEVFTRVEVRYTLVYIGSYNRYYIWLVRFIGISPMNKIFRQEKRGVLCSLF
jgi:hypothetical protein